MPTPMVRSTRSKTTLLSGHDWRRLRAWFKGHGRCLPWRQNADPWRILVAETLLHRTGANVVKTLYPIALKEFPSPRAVIAKRKQWITFACKGGLFWRARTFISACEILVKVHGGRVPSDRRELENLSGVGHYIASAVRCFGFGQREFITDTNTIRLAGRLAGKVLNPANHRTKRIQALTARLNDNGRPPLPEDNYALLDLAATICKPRKPLCPKCPLCSSCRTARIQKRRRFLR